MLLYFRLALMILLYFFNNFHKYSDITSIFYPLNFKQSLTYVFLNQIFSVFDFCFISIYIFPISRSDGDIISCTFIACHTTETMSRPFFPSRPKLIPRQFLRQHKLMRRKTIPGKNHIPIGSRAEYRGAPRSGFLRRRPGTNACLARLVFSTLQALAGWTFYRLRFLSFHRVQG